MNSNKKKISLESNPLFCGLQTNTQNNLINTPKSKQ